MKNILCIQHADFETPGVIEDWAHGKSVNFSVQKPYTGETLTAQEIDFLIVMGGPQSPLKIDKYPYLQDEINLIKEIINQNKPVLGFCLGAQLIGEALGAKTEKSPHKEVGVFPIKLTSDGRNDPLLKDFPSEFPVIHWHNDMPGLTSESQILAFSEGCPRQIIKYKENVYGFQCHLEISLSGIRELISAVPGDLTPSLYVQSSDILLQHEYESINKKMYEILNQKIFHL